MSAAVTFRRTISSVSPRPWRRSEWPRMTTRAPASQIWAGDTHPVKAPAVSQCASCAPSRTGEPASTSATALQRRERRAHRDADVGQPAAAVAHGRRQRPRLRERGVHLPVARDHRGARHGPVGHQASSRAATPGSVRPSRYSRNAPPPWTGIRCGRRRRRPARRPPSPRRPRPTGRARPRRPARGRACRPRRAPARRRPSARSR